MCIYVHFMCICISQSGVAMHLCNMYSKTTNNLCVHYSYSTGPGIYGSKLTRVRGCSPRTRAVYVAIIPGNRAITIIPSEARSFTRTRARSYGFNGYFSRAL